VPPGTIIVGCGGLLIAAGAIGFLAPGALPQVPALTDPTTAWLAWARGLRSTTVRPASCSNGRDLKQ
jgi:hypothetical protein